MDTDRNSPVPLYYQLKQILTKTIDSGELAPCQRIPTERELGEKYQLSRTTVRHAINELVAAGLLYRERGRGTFVSKRKLRHGPQRPFGLSGYMRAHGLKGGWKLLRMHPVAPPKEVAEQLNLAEGAKALMIERLRLADGEIIGRHIVYVPMSLGLQFTETELVEGDSSLSYLDGKEGLSFSETHRIIQAVAATAREARLLRTRKGAPLLLVQRTTISAEGKPVEYLHALYRGDRFEYYIHFEH